jgi:hypothetical protein
MASQNPEPKLELSLSQLPEQPLQLIQPSRSCLLVVLRMKLDHLNKESGHVSISFGMKIFKKILELW